MTTTPRTEPSPFEPLLDFLDTCKDLEPWCDLSEHDFFAVEHPGSGVPYVFSTMGAAQSVFGFNIYAGEHALATYFNMIDLLEEDDEDQPGRKWQAYLEQDCFHLSLEDRSDMSPQDLALVRQSGRKYRGKKAWPQFRRFIPAHQLWPLSDQQAQEISPVLEQAITILQSIHDETFFPEGETPDHDHITLPLWKPVGGHWQWDRWTADISPIALPVISLSELSLARICKSAPTHEGQYVVDLLLAPMAISDKMPPWFPYMFVMLDPQGMLHNSDFMYGPDLAVELPRVWEQMLLKLGHVPDQLLAGQTRLADALLPVANQLGIKLYDGSSNQELQTDLYNIREDLFRHMRNL